jgi:metal-responsive CopG/Arc/MetJ family transcriptional regulator
MSPMTQTAFRLDDEDFAILDDVKRRTGLSSRSDAMRYVLRQYAQQHGLASWGPAVVAKKAPKATKRRK